MGLVLDVGSAQPIGSPVGGFYGTLTYELDLPASRRLSREFGRLRRTWIKQDGLRRRGAQRQLWKWAESRLREMPFCVRDERVITSEGQTAELFSMMRHILVAT